jgi:hypothetical protein
LFVGLSLLSFLLALQGDDEEIVSPAGFKWGWLIASGVLTGLAWLSKSPAIFLVPFVGLVAVIEAWRRGTPVRAWLLRLVVWGAVAWLTFAVVWPAGWVNPIGAPYSVVHNAFLSATDKVEAGAEGYWLVPNLGPFYYLVNGAYKLSAQGIIPRMVVTDLCCAFHRVYDYRGQTQQPLYPARLAGTLLALGIWSRSNSRSQDAIRSTQYAVRNSCGFASASYPACPGDLPILPHLFQPSDWWFLDRTSVGENRLG